jgi:hypothetical protein
MIQRMMKTIATWLWNTAFIQALVASELQESHQPEGEA